jgi:predicted DNA-binding protein with PD1-like motif
MSATAGTGLPEPIRQPGPAPVDRILAVPAVARHFSFDIAAGMPLLDGIAAGFVRAGFSSGIALLGPLLLHPFRYVMPALSDHPEHAAYYSPVFLSKGAARVDCGAMTFGTRAGAPFFHAHALWDEPERGPRGGHILPEGTIVAADQRIEAIGLAGAAFVSEPDPEINFTVFGPVKVQPVRDLGGSAALAMRLRPNVDPIAAILEAARTHGIERGRVWGGVGSTIGARFATGEALDTLATEIFIRDGALQASAGEGGVRLDLGLVDHLGQIRRARLAPRRNRVLMTMELVIEALD